MLKGEVNPFLISAPGTYCILADILSLVDRERLLHRPGSINIYHLLSSLTGSQGNHGQFPGRHSFINKCLGHVRDWRFGRNYPPTYTVVVVFLVLGTMKQ